MQQNRKWYLRQEKVFEIIDKFAKARSETSHNSSFIQDFKMKMRDILLSNLSAEEKLQKLNELRQS